MLLQWLCNDNAPSYCRDEIDDVRYHKEADHTLEYLVEAFENLLDGIDADDADVELSQGVLNLNLGSIGTYVINKQTPNKQIWVSSPVRYGMHSNPTSHIMCCNPAPIHP